MALTVCEHAEVGFDGLEVWFNGLELGEHAEVGFDGLELGVSMQRWGLMVLNWV